MYKYIALEFEKSKYTLVLKYRPDHDDYLNMSPYQRSFDRRWFRGYASKIANGKVKSVIEGTNATFKPLSKNAASALINKQWNEMNNKWYHSGKRYMSSRTVLDYGTEELSKDLGDIARNPKKTIHRNELDPMLRQKTVEYMKSLPTHEIKTANGTSIPCKLLDKNGDLCYVREDILGYYPKMMTYSLEGNRIGWADIKNLKPVYCYDDQTWI